LKLRSLLPTLTLIPLFAVWPEVAEAKEPGAEEIRFWLNNVWVLLAAFLVFVMHLGFAALESGLTRSKNTVNILFKNVTIVAIGLLTYACVGFNLMYPGEASAGGWFGFAGFWINAPANGMTAAYADGKYTYWTDFIFQGMFAATAATIVSGAVAERAKLSSFLIFSTVLVALVYPIVGMWHWGGGWLSAAGFHDFAGSTIVHSVGGWAALAGVMVIGPRHGKYVGDTVKPIIGHNVPLAAIGVFLLWFGWYGFNGGSVLSAEPGAISLVVVTTSLAAAAGVLAASVMSRIVQKKVDLTMALNGALAGLVGVTAGADVLTPFQAVIVGAIAGVFVLLAVIGIDRIKLDDPVGAISVHLICGIWGTLAVGIFAADKSFLTQLKGVGMTAVFVFSISFGVFWLLKKTVGVRVSEEEELRGLDIEEHGMESYGGFQIFTLN